MRTTSTLVSAALVASVSAHTRIWSAWVNGVDQGDGRTAYIRSPPNNDPVKDMTSTNLVCGVSGATPASSFVSAAAGDTIALEWYHDTRGDDILASSHKGPIITWIAPYFEDDGAAPIWTKIAEAGYDGSTWATDAMIAAKGMAEFTIPSNLAAGQYMIRQEVIALHEADACYATAGSRGAQFYPSCVQFEITGSGSGVPSQNFDFNAEYSCAVEGIEFNVYGSFTEYPIPGPSVDTTLAGTSSSGTTDTSSSGSTDTSASSAASSSASTPTTAASGSTSTSDSSANGSSNNSASSPTTTSAPAATTLSTSTVSGAVAVATGAGDSSSCSKRKARRAALREAARKA